MSTLFSPIYVTQIAYIRGCWSRPLGEKKRRISKLHRKGNSFYPKSKLLSVLLYNINDETHN